MSNDGMSIPAYLDTLNLQQLEYIEKAAKKRSDSVKKGGRVTLWRVGTSHSNNYITDDIERAIAFMRLELDNFVRDKRYDIQLTDMTVYAAELKDYLSCWSEENRSIDTAIKQENLS